MKQLIVLMLVLGFSFANAQDSENNAATGVPPITEGEPAPIPWMQVMCTSDTDLTPDMKTDQNLLDGRTKFQAFLTNPAQAVTDYGTEYKTDLQNYLPTPDGQAYVDDLYAAVVNDGTFEGEKSAFVQERTQFTVNKAINHFSTNACRNAELMWEYSRGSGITCNKADGTAVDFAALETFCTQ